MENSKSREIKIENEKFNLIKYNYNADTQIDVI